MDFICLDGSVTKIDVKPSSFPPRNVSDLQVAARERIEQMYSGQIILEEFPIPKTKMRLDFFLPFLKVAIEVHGKQHDEFVKHFHGTHKGFVEAKKRDEDKAEWCRLNGIELIVWRRIDWKNG